MASCTMLFLGRTLTTMAATAVVSTYMFWLYPVLRDYGFAGALAYLKEGDPLPPDVRERKELLQSIALKLNCSEITLSSIEQGLKRASLYSMYGSLAQISRNVWQGYVPDIELQKGLVLLSHDLDQLAAQIDQVISTVEIKSMKKELSNRVVKLMERADVLISVYKHACIAEREQ